MAEQTFAEYGNRRIPIPEGMTQAQVTEQMRRFFPELADPKIESKTDGDKKVWVYSKKAGTKGMRRPVTHADLLARLAAVPETPLAPAWVIGAALEQPVDVGDAEAAGRAMMTEARQVDGLAAALGRLQPDWPVAPTQPGQAGAGGILL